MAEKEDPFETVLFARKLAHFCPTSISSDDLTMPSMIEISHKKMKFIPPEPVVIIEKEQQKVVTEAPKNHRFASLFKDIKPEKAVTKTSKMKYELPNVYKVNTPTKTSRPVMAVSLSVNNLAEIASSKNEHKENGSKRVSSDGLESSDSCE